MQTGSINNTICPNTKTSGRGIKNIPRKREVKITDLDQSLFRLNYEYLITKIIADFLGGFGYGKKHFNKKIKHPKKINLVLEFTNQTP